MPPCLSLPPVSVGVFYTAGYAHVLTCISPTNVPMHPLFWPQVHHMLVMVARSLIAGGESGVFSPMHMMVFRKPGKKN